MFNVQPGPHGSTSARAASAEVVELDDGALARLLAANDTESIAQLARWLKTHARTFAPVVTRAVQDGPGLSPEAASAVLDAMAQRSTTSGDTTLQVLEVCLETIAAQVTSSIATNGADALGDADDALLGSAVAILTSNRPASHSEAAINRLAQSGPGGALVLARAFDAIRRGLKVSVVQQLDPADVLQLGDNVVASLARSVTRLAEELEGPPRSAAIKFVAALGPVHYLEPSEIGVTETLQPRDRVFHASWGAGVVVAADGETVTIDFGSAGTRTLLRSLAKLRRAV